MDQFAAPQEPGDHLGTILSTTSVTTGRVLSASSVLNSGEEASRFHGGRAVEVPVGALVVPGIRWEGQDPIPLVVPVGEPEGERRTLALTGYMGKTVAARHLACAFLFAEPEGEVWWCEQDQRGDGIIFPRAFIGSLPEAQAQAVQSRVRFLDGPPEQTADILTWSHLDALSRAGEGSRDSLPPRLAVVDHQALGTDRWGRAAVSPIWSALQAMKAEAHLVNLRIIITAEVLPAEDEWWQGIGTWIHFGPLGQPEAAGAREILDDTAYAQVGNDAHLGSMNRPGIGRLFRRGHTVAGVTFSHHA